MNDAEQLSQDLTFPLIGSEKIWERRAALTSRLQTFETEMVAEDENFSGLGRLSQALMGKAESTGISILEYRIARSVHRTCLNVTLTSIFTATGTPSRLAGSNFQVRTVAVALSSRPAPSGSEVCLTAETFP